MDIRENVHFLVLYSRHTRIHHFLITCCCSAAGLYFAGIQTMEDLNIVLAMAESWAGVAAIAASLLGLIGLAWLIGAALGPISGALTAWLHFMLRRSAAREKWAAERFHATIARGGHFDGLPPDAAREAAKARRWLRNGGLDEPRLMRLSRYLRLFR